MKQVIHKHHIVPRYRCNELGIDPDFDDNIVEVTRLQHANIHWGYWCKDLSALLEVCSPPQYVIDMIPLGDKRDIPSSQVLAEGEIGGIDISGENNPHWKGGITLDIKAYDKKRNQTPERKEYMKKYLKEYKQTPEYKESQRKHNQTPERKEYMKEWARKYHIKNRDKILAYKKEQYAKKKLERQGTGTLEQFMG